MSNGITNMTYKIQTPKYKNEQKNEYKDNESLSSQNLFQLYLELQEENKKFKEKLADYPFTLITGKYKCVCQNNEVKYYCYVKKEKKIKKKSQKNKIVFNNDFDLSKEYILNYHNKPIRIYKDEFDLLIYVNKNKGTILDGELAYIKETNQLYIFNGKLYIFELIVSEDVLGKIYSTPITPIEQEPEYETQYEWVQKEFDLNEWRKL